MTLINASFLIKVRKKMALAIPKIHAKNVGKKTIIHFKLLPVITS